MKTKEEILAKYLDDDRTRFSILKAMEEYHAQFTQPITEEEIEKEADEYKNASTAFGFECGANWAIERMKKDDRELLVKFIEYHYGKNNKYTPTLVDEFLNSNK